MATVGGTIVHADPNSDVAPALLALESKVLVTSREGTRELPLDTVYTDFYETCIDRTELLEAIVIPIPPEGCTGTYTRFEIRKSMDKAMPGVAVLVELEDDRKTIRRARIAMTGVGNIPIRMKEEEEYLAGKEYTSDAADGISETIQRKVDPLPEHHYSTDYKKAVAGITLKRAVSEAVHRAAAHR
jgi:CO/xanthine dehydrogenase FAD-binding subunit